VAGTWHHRRVLDAPNRTRLSWMPYAASLVGGLLFGGLTLVLQGVLPRFWNHLGNSGAIWVVGAYIAGACLAGDRWRPVVAGTLVELGEVVGYYGSTTVFLHDDLSRSALTGPVAWGAVALLTGPIFGTAGAWRRDERLGRRVASIGLLGGVFVAEAVALLVGLHYVAEAAVMATIGVVLASALARNGRERLYGMLALVAAAVVGYGGYLLLDKVLQPLFVRGL
jgi:hypothetical protein